MPKMTVKLSTLRANPRNPRKISPVALERLCESITRDPEFMVLRPIVVDGDKVILGGNQRFRACQQLGFTEIPATWVRVVTELTPEQRERFIIADNAPAGMAGDWDYELLLEDWDRTELAGLGFELADLTEYIEEWDGVPKATTAPEESKSIAVHFRNDGDVALFAVLIGQQITDGTRSVWYPAEGGGVDAEHQTEHAEGERA